MRTIVMVIGVIVLLLGIVWALQGAGVLLGSFMSNSSTWLWIGAITAVVGWALLVLGIRLPNRAKPAEPT